MQQLLGLWHRRVTVCGVCYRVWDIGVRGWGQPLQSKAQASAASKRVCFYSSAFHASKCLHPHVLCEGSSNNCRLPNPMLGTYQTWSNLVLSPCEDVTVMLHRVAACLHAYKRLLGYIGSLNDRSCGIDCSFSLLVSLLSCLVCPVRSGGAGCRGAKIRVVPCSAVPDDAYVVDASYMGAPTVSIEKLDSSQAEAAAHAVLKVWPRLVIGVVPSLVLSGAAGQSQHWLWYIIC